MKRTVRRQSIGGSVGSGVSRASSKTRQRSEDDHGEKEPVSKLLKATHDRKSRLPSPAVSHQ